MRFETGMKVLCAAQIDKLEREENVKKGEDLRNHTVFDLLEFAKEEMKELEKALHEYNEFNVDAESVVLEAGDVANYLAMICQKIYK